MQGGRLVMLFGLLSGACSRGAAPPAADSAAVARHLADSVLSAHQEAAPALLDTARETMVQLLEHPATAMFDSLRVVQPAMKDGVWPAPAVCGRLGGKPGVKGATGMTPFIYLNRVTVFVLDPSNGEAFGKLWADDCGGPGTRVLGK